MKNGTLATKLMMAAIFLTVLVYFGVNLAAYFTDPYTTTVAYAYTGERAVTVSGYVARSEEVLPGGGQRPALPGGAAGAAALRPHPGLRESDLRTAGRGGGRRPDQVPAGAVQGRADRRWPGRFGQVALRPAQAQLRLLRYGVPGDLHRQPPGADQQSLRRGGPQHHAGDRPQGRAVLQPGGRLRDRPGAAALRWARRRGPPASGSWSTA